VAYLDSKPLVEFGRVVIEEKLTVTMASRVARDMMSAQETMPGQALQDNLGIIRVFSRIDARVLAAP
jgi:hypothetical protein